MPVKFRKIEIKTVDKVYIELDKTSASRTPTGVVGKKMKVTSDLIPHRDFFRAIDKMTTHLLVGSQLIKPEFTLINKVLPMDEEWFKNWAWKDDERFSNVKLTGIVIHGKETPEAITLFGYKFNHLGEKVPLKTFKLSLIRQEKDNYPLLDILDAQFETVLTEAEEYNNELKFNDGDQLDLYDEEKNEKKLEGMRVA